MYKYKVPITIVFIILFLSSEKILAQTKVSHKINPDEYAMIKSNRKDGRFINARGIAQSMLRDEKPKLAYNPNFSRTQFRNWQKKVKEAMKKLMNFPDLKTYNAPSPKMLYVKQKDGYKLQKWEIYPLPHAAVRFLVLVPNKLRRTPSPAVFCITGTGGTKEGMASAPFPFNNKVATTGPYRKKYGKHNKMAVHYAKMGIIAVSVDNPGFGEQADLSNVANRGWVHGAQILAKKLLELGWSYLGYSTFLKTKILKWMEKQPDIDKSKIIVSGLSLGTEPLMTLGVLNPEIFAFVYNDYLCRTRERQLILTKPDSKGYRPIPNHSIIHSVPNFWKYFDFPDIVASLAPRPVLITGGGLVRDIKLVKSAYKKVGEENNFKVNYYNEYSDPKNRSNIKKLPEGISRAAYLRLENVVPSRHFFKNKVAIPWVKSILNMK